MRTTRIAALLLAVVLCLETGLTLKQRVFAGGAGYTAATPVNVSAKPQEAVLGAEVEIIGETDVSGEIALKVSADLNADYLESKIKAYAEGIVSASDAVDFADSVTEDETVSSSALKNDVTLPTGREALDALGGEQDIRSKLDSLGNSWFPQITYSLTLDGTVFISVANPGNSGEIYAEGTLIGSYTISEGTDGNHVLTAALDRYVYYLVPSTVEYTVNTHIADDGNTGKTASGLALDNGAVFSLTFESTGQEQPDNADFAAPESPSFASSSGAVESGNLKDVISGLATPPYTVNNVTINESIFSLLNIDVDSPDSSNGSMQLLIECVFNEDFLERCWLAAGNYNSAMNFPGLSFDFTFNTHDVTGSDSSKQYFKFDDNTYAYVVSDRNINIGEITIKESPSGSGIYNFHIEFYPEEIYGAGEARGTAAFEAWLEGSDRKTWTPEIVTGASGEISIKWTAPVNPSFPNNELFSAAKSIANTTTTPISTPYIDYTLVFAGNTAAGGDLRYLTIVDDLKEQTQYGLNALGFTYEITLDDGSVKSAAIDLPLANSSAVTANSQPFIYLKASNAALTSANFDPPRDVGGLTPITNDSLSGIQASENGEVFILDVEKLIDKLGVGSDKVVTNVKITLNTIMDATAYKKYMDFSDGNNPTGGSFQFKNQALGFYDDGGANKTAIGSNVLITPITFTYFKKDGVRSGEKMHYTISAATYFVNGRGDAYIVDRINSSQHTLDAGSVWFTPQGGTKTQVTPIDNVTSTLENAGGGDLRKTYAVLKAMSGDNAITALNTIWTTLSKQIGTSGGAAKTEAVYYTLGDEQIVIYRIGSAHLNKPLTLEYDTVIKTGSYDYNNIQNDAMILVKNNYLGGIIGPGGTIPPDPIGTISKTVGIDYRIASKSPTSSSFSGQTLTWRITFNTALETLTNVIVVDEIDNSAMILSTLGGTTAGTLAKDSFGAGAEIALSNGVKLSYITPADFAGKGLASTTTVPSDTGNYFTYDNTSDSGKEILKFYIAELDKVSPYVTVTATLVDASVLAGNSSTVNNKVKAWCWDGSGLKGQPDVTASASVSLTKISKTCNAGYDYSDGTMKWTVKANITSPKLNIKNMVVTDFLPPESYISKITKITYDGTDYTVNEAFAEDTSNAQSVILPVGDFYVKAVVEKSTAYATPVTNAMYNAVRFIVTDASGNQTGIILDKELDISIETKFKKSYKEKFDFSNTATATYTNSTTLDGVVGHAETDGTFTYDETKGTIDKTALTASGGDALNVDRAYYNNSNKKAKASANTTLPQFRPALKSAEYDQNGQNGYVGPNTAHWTMVINRDMYEGIVSGEDHAVVADEVNPSGKEWFILETGTMKVSTAVLDSSGAWSYATAGGGDIYDATVTPANTPSGIFTVPPDTNGFSFIVPENKVYVIEYDTTVIAAETLYYRDITNTAVITYPGGRSGSFTSTGIGTSGNVAHTYASINYLPYIYIVKSHKSTTVNPSTLIPNLRLNDVEFSVIGYEYDPLTKTVDYNNVVYPKRTETTAPHGSVQAGGSIVAAMFPLPRSVNAVYILTEENLGPYTDTYNLDAKPRYFRVEPDSGEVNYDAAEYIKGVDEQYVEVEVITTNSKVVFYDDTINVSGLENADTYGHVVEDNLQDGKYYATVVMFDSLIDEPNQTTTGKIKGLKTAYSPYADTETPLAHALFGLYDNYSKALNPNDVGVAHVGSNRFGEFEFNNIKQGTYYIRELYAPDPAKYDMSDMLDPNDNTKINPEKIITVVMTGAAGTTVTEDINGNPIKVRNDEIAIEAEILGYKVDESGAPLEGAEFGLFAGDTTDFETAVPLKTAVSTLNGNGGAEFLFTNLYVNPEDCPVTYYVRELSAPYSYYKSEKTYTIVLEKPARYGKNIVELIEEDVNGDPLIVHNSKIIIEAEVVGRKVDENDAPLAGAEFGLFAENTTDFETAIPLKTAVSELNGNGGAEFRFTNIYVPLNDCPVRYYVKELSPPSGYYKSDEIYTVVLEKPARYGNNIVELIDKDENGGPIIMRNDKIMIEAEIAGRKVNQNNAPLVGAEFGLFAGNTANFDTAVPLKTAVSDLNAGGTAEFRFTNLYVDPDDCPVTYYVRELSAPSGYYKSDKTYTIVLNKPAQYGKDIVEFIEEDANGGQIVFVNNPISGGSTGGGGGGGGSSNPNVTSAPTETTEPSESPEPETTGSETAEPEIPTDAGFETQEQEAAIPQIEPINAEPALVPPVLSEVPESEILHPVQLPSNYSAVKVDDNTYVIYEDDIPLGYVIVPDGMTLDDIDILDELIPFGMPEFSDDDVATIKKNPVTSDNSYGYIASFVVAALILISCVMLRKRSKKNIAEL